MDVHEKLPTIPVQTDGEFTAQRASNTENVSI